MLITAVLLSFNFEDKKKLDEEVISLNGVLQGVLTDNIPILM